MKVHTLVKTLKNVKFDKMFTYCSYLKIHERRQTRKNHITHTCEKPHKCKLCKQQFTENSILRVHLSKHISENLKQCKVCDKKFITRSN